jgi:hypothetical protein
MQQINIEYLINENLKEMIKMNNKVLSNKNISGICKNDNRIISTKMLNKEKNWRILKTYTLHSVNPFVNQMVSISHMKVV